VGRFKLGEIATNFSATESYFHYVLFPWLKYKGYERLQTGRIFSKESRQKLTSFGFKPATQFGESTMVFDLTSFTPPPGQGVGEFFDRLMGLYDSRAPRVVAKAA
jgi:hypothetical protein